VILRALIGLIGEIALCKENQVKSLNTYEKNKKEFRVSGEYSCKSYYFLSFKGWDMLGEK
jgi:hypothetical protein